jgi:hypothetical protein
MPIDDELEKSSVAAEIQEQAEQTAQDMLVKSGMAGALSLIPLGVGSAISQMLTELAFRRTNERMKRMFDQMAQHIRELGEEKIDREWFRGEEFQTLLFEALHQLHATESEDKIRMLGKALANSGATEFKNEDRKDIFLRLIRELAPQHVLFLRRLLPKRPKEFSAEEYPDWMIWANRPKIFGRGTELLVLQMLAANSLVEEIAETKEVRLPSLSITSSEEHVRSTLKDFFDKLQRASVRYFLLSESGRDFLKFVGAEAEVVPKPEASAAAK